MVVVLDRAEAMESWLGSVPWRDFEIEVCQQRTPLSNTVGCAG